MSGNTGGALLRHVAPTVIDLMAQRKTQAKLSDTDRFEPFVMAIWETPEMGVFLRAMDDGEVVEGSPRADDQEIARMCREAARMAKDKIVGTWNLDHCRRALGAVMRRFASSRRDISGKRTAD
jgi:hypothetical protein